MRITNNRGSTGRPFTTSPGRLSAGDPQGGARAENAKSLPFGLPNSIDLKIWRQLKPYSNRLTRLKVETARKKFRREVESETNKLYIGKRGDANSKAVPNTRLNIILQETNEFLEQQYSIFRDVWLKLGGSESAAFIRTHLSDGDPAPVRRQNEFFCPCRANAIPSRRGFAADAVRGARPQAL